MNPKIVELEKFRVMGIQVQDSPKSGEFGKTWPKLFERCREIVPLAKTKVSYGVQSYDEQLMKRGVWKYTAALQATEDSATPDGMISITLPKTKYAVFEYKGAVGPKLGETFEYIYNKWLPHSKYILSGRYDFEMYDERFLGPENHKSILDIYIPITEKMV